MKVIRLRSLRSLEHPNIIVWSPVLWLFIVCSAITTQLLINQNPQTNLLVITAHLTPCLSLLLNTWALIDVFSTFHRLKKGGMDKADQSPKLLGCCILALYDDTEGQWPELYLSKGFPASKRSNLSLHGPWKPWVTCCFFSLSVSWASKSLTSLIVQRLKIICCPILCLHHIFFNQSKVASVCPSLLISTEESQHTTIGWLSHLWWESQ